MLDCMAYELWVSLHYYVSICKSKAAKKNMIESVSKQLFAAFSSYFRFSSRSNEKVEEIGFEEMPTCCTTADNVDSMQLSFF